MRSAEDGNGYQAWQALLRARTNKNAEEYATRTGERVRQHLMFNQSRLSTAEEVAQETEHYRDATEEFSRDDKGQAGTHRSNAM